MTRLGLKQMIEKLEKVSDEKCCGGVLVEFNWHVFFRGRCLEYKGPALKPRLNPVARFRCFKGQY